MDHKKVIKNAGWIIVCRIVQSVLGLMISMMTARYLGPSHYGLINYAASLAAFATPIMQLGMNAVLVQEIVNAGEEDGKILGTVLLLCLGSGAVCVAAILAFASLVNHGETATIIVCGLYSILLVFQALEMMQYWFQAQLMSKYPSLVSLFAYVCVSLYKIYLLVTRKSIYWFAFSNTLDSMIIAVLLLILYKRIGKTRLKFSKTTAVRLFAKSRYYIVSDMMVTVFAQTDRIMLKLIINDAAAGFYSAAVACAGMTSFIFAAIIDSARPSIFACRKYSQESFENHMTGLYSVIFYLALIQSIFISLFAGIIVHILYGPDYVQTVPALRLLVWYTTFSYLGSVRNIWILAEGKQRYLWMVNLAGVCMNVIINILCIPQWGIMGASFASLITQFFTNFIVGYLIRPIAHNNEIMIRGLNPRYCIGLAKKMLRQK